MATEPTAIEARHEPEDTSPKRGHRRRLASHARGHQKGRPQEARPDQLLDAFIKDNPEKQMNISKVSVMANSQCNL
jgi:hypothetical protein